MPKNKHMVKNGLSPKQLKFCEEYVKDHNGTQSAIRAGYSEKGANVRGAELLAKSNVQKEIQRISTEISKRNGVTAERVLKEFEILGFSRIDDYVEIEEGGGIKIKRFPEIDKAKIAAIKKIKNDRIIREVPGPEKTDEIIVHDKTSFELHDKIRPLIKLGEYTGLFDSELPPGSGQQIINNDFKIMMVAVNGDKIKEIDFSKMIDIGKKQANDE